MKISPQEFVAKMLKNSFIYAALMCILLAFPLANEGYHPAWAAALFPIAFGFIFAAQQKQPKSHIAARAKEMENEVLFAGRYLLVKMSSGRPLFNALIDAANSYGVASKYFKEIVDDITFGTPIEQALENAQNLSPSKNFRKILFQINNALKVGIDVTNSLESTLQEIEYEQQQEIERYGKKLSTIALFYMLGAIVIPSLGLTIFVVITGLLSFQLNVFIYVTILICIALIQIFFMSLFRKIRPSVNI